MLQFEGPEEGDYPDFIRDVGAITMGSTTYEWIRSHHIRAAVDRAPCWPYEQPTCVFTSPSLPMVRNGDIRFVRGDIRPVHRERVEAVGDKNIWIVGGGELAGQFYDQGLLDDLIVTIAPVTLGGRAPLLSRAITTPPFRLLPATTYAHAFAQLCYQVPRRPR